MRVSPVIPTFPSFMRFENKTFEFKNHYDNKNPGFKKANYHLNCQPIKPEEPKLVFKGVQDNPNGKLNFIA